MQYCVRCSRKIHFTFAIAKATAITTETRSADAQNSGALRTTHGHSIRVFNIFEMINDIQLLLVCWFSPNSEKECESIAELMRSNLIFVFNCKILSANNRPNECKLTIDFDTLIEIVDCNLNYFAYYLYSKCEKRSITYLHRIKASHRSWNSIILPRTRHSANGIFSKMQFNLEWKTNIIIDIWNVYALIQIKSAKETKIIIIIISCHFGFNGFL